MNGWLFFIMSKNFDREYLYVISHKQEMLVSWCLYSVSEM